MVSKKPSGSKIFIVVSLIVIVILAAVTLSYSVSPEGNDSSGIDTSTLVAIVLFFLTVINGGGVFILNGIYKKISDICSQNDKDHDELFTARRQTEKKIEAIETIHRIKGCDLPKKDRE